jgi:hypothetical protein
LWLFSVLGACAVLALLVANAPTHTSTVAVRTPVPTADTSAKPKVAARHTKQTTSKSAVTTPPTQPPARAAVSTPTTTLEPPATTSATTPATIAPTAVTTPATVAPSLPAPTPVVAHLAITG